MWSDLHNCRDSLHNRRHDDIHTKLHPNLCVATQLHDCQTIEVQKLRKLHSNLVCLNGWCLVSRPHGYVCHWNKTMRLRNLHRLWPVCPVGIGAAAQLSHLPLGRGDLPLRYLWSIRGSASGKHCGIDRSSHLRIIGICPCVISGMSIPRSRYGLCRTSTIFCIVWMVVPWC